MKYSFRTGGNGHWAQNDLTNQSPSLTPGKALHTPQGWWLASSHGKSGKTSLSAFTYLWFAGGLQFKVDVCQHTNILTWRPGSPFSQVYCQAWCGDYLEKWSTFISHFLFFIIYSKHYTFNEIAFFFPVATGNSNSIQACPLFYMKQVFLNQQPS